MAHPVHHSESSARKFGGAPDDYLAVHDWFDASKAHDPRPVHRALRHHAFGIFEAESVFGHVITNSDAREVPVRFIGEQHVREDCRRIPTVSDWLGGIRPASWMIGGAIKSAEEEASDRMREDPMAGWKAHVAAGKTVLGFKDWLEMRKMARQP
ncbi:MAG: hypothetical protein F4213_13150 [Boseongicola sp. SB0677_bin_26]|nr:hypothetical protein [Boseongicola sp. SB0665_bin_10]MYG26947.1 hypothetical protein [Boseongicola sp. SB0677_bin_26]